VTDKPLHTLSLIEASQGIRKRRFTSEAYTEALLARIESLDEEIQAWTWLRPAEAIRAARLSDRHLHSGAAPGPLQGLPIGVKDIYATAGIPTEMGSPSFAGHIPNESAKVIERLAARGAFVMGKTVTTECAFLTPGKTHNPWNPLHTPGRVVQRFRRGGCGRLCPRRPGYADQRLRYPARRLLWGCGF